MKIKRLHLQGFTVFEDATFDFAPGINVLIGENGTGKSHVLKVVYALAAAAQRFEAGIGLEGAKNPTLVALVRGMLMGVFQPDALTSFARTTGKAATVSVEWEEAEIEVQLGQDSSKMVLSNKGSFAKIGRPLFIPPREVLSIYPGFAAAWLLRESEFDRTYFDLCVALDLKLLRRGGPRALLDPIEKELFAAVVKKEGRFYLDHDDGHLMEMSMVAEGDRKLAMIAYLLMNGSLSQNTYLLWDEPEANLNPKRALLFAKTARSLSEEGVQVFLATHDYALASEISLMVDTGELKAGEAAFFGLSRNSDQEMVIERGSRFTDLQENAILSAFSSLSRREEEAMFDKVQEKP